MIRRQTERFLKQLQHRPFLLYHSPLVRASAAASEISTLLLSSLIVNQVKHKKSLRQTLHPSHMTQSRTWTRKHELRPNVATAFPLRYTTKMTLILKVKRRRALCLTLRAVLERNMSKAHQSRKSRVLVTKRKKRRREAKAMRSLTEAKEHQSK